MMIASPSAGDMYARAAALDRALRSGGSEDGGDAATPADATPPDAGPDVVVSLSGGASSPPATYDASGRMGGAPTLDDLGANAPDSLAHATESHGDASAADASDTPDATSTTAAPAAVPADQDAAVPA
jgi:hypothetical protein